MQHNGAIVLAMFGTTVDSSLRGLLAVRDALARTWPPTPAHPASPPGAGAVFGAGGA